MTTGKKLNKRLTGVFKMAHNGRVLGEGWALVAQNFKIRTDVK